MNIGIIGLGNMGINHARIFSQLKNVELIAICDKDKSKSSANLNLKFYEDYKVMIKNEHLDAISICAPTAIHYDLASYCLSCGINTLIEKPMALSLDHAQMLVETANNNDAKLMVGHVERFNPAVIALRNILKHKDVGKILTICSNRIGSFPQVNTGCGVIFDIAIHDLDIISSLVNKDIQSVFATTRNIIPITPYEDIAQMNLRFLDGTIASVHANWITPIKLRDLIVICENNVLKINYITQELTATERILHPDQTTKSFDEYLKYSTSGNSQTINVQKAEPLKLELEHFIDCVRNNRSPLTDGLAGLRAVKLATLALESARTNKVIKVN